MGGKENGRTCDASVRVRGTANEWQTRRASRFPVSFRQTEHDDLARHPAKYADGGQALHQRSPDALSALRESLLETA